MLDNANLLSPLNRSGGHARRNEPVVVVADDDPGIRAVVSQLLQANGFFAVSCGDGESAVNLVRQLRPSLVLLDIRMPVMDGLTACREIRRETTIPVIMLTVLDDESEAARALDAGADDYVRKPFGTQGHSSRESRLSSAAWAVVALGSSFLSSALCGSMRRSQIASINGDEIHLSSTELDLLAYLAGNLNRVVTHTHCSSTSGATTTTNRVRQCAWSSIDCVVSWRTPKTCNSKRWRA